MMRADAGFHPDQARSQVGKPRFHLATRPFLSQRNRAALIEPNNVERVLPNINADHGDCALGLLRHGVLLGFDAPRQLQALARQEHGRTSAARLAAIPAGESPANRGVQTLL
jgi:hypothetical protein